jgi:hypothetical protein
MLSLEGRERIIQANKKSWADPEARAKRLSSLKKACTPEYKEKLSISTKAAFAKPEVKERKSKAAKEAWGRPEVRESRMGENNGRWNDGNSYKPYCPRFTKELKEEIRIKFHHKCLLCPTIQKKNGRKLCIHHIDYNKNAICNGTKWALIPLCLRCHLKTNSNRWYWFNLLINYWVMNEEINFESLDLYINP